LFREFYYRLPLFFQENVHQVDLLRAPWASRS
jgi:hypothetical protein